MNRPSRRKALGLSIAGVLGAAAVAGGVAFAVGPSPAAPIAATTFVLTTTDFPGLAFNSCTGLGSKTDVVENATQNSTGGTTLREVAAATHPDRVVCTRGTARDLTLEQWRRLVVDGQMAKARQTGTIATYDSAGTKTASWSVTAAWPSELLDAPNSTGGMTETVTFAMDAQSRTQ